MFVYPSNNINFKGLWGSSSTHVHGNDDISIVVNNIKYHPFSDESQKEIDSVVSKNERHNKSNNFYNITFYDECIVSVKQRLNFTKKEYKAYCNKTLPGEAYARVANSLKENGLFDSMRIEEPIEDLLQSKKRISFWNKIIKLFKK